MSRTIHKPLRMADSCFINCVQLPSDFLSLSDENGAVGIFQCLYCSKKLISLPINNFLTCDFFPGAEAWLSHVNPDDAFAIQENQPFSKYRPARLGGGHFLSVCDSVPAMLCKDCRINRVQYVKWLRGAISNKRLLNGYVFRPPAPS